MSTPRAWKADHRSASDSFRFSSARDDVFSGSAYRTHTHRGPFLSTAAGDGHGWSTSDDVSLRPQRGSGRGLVKLDNSPGNDAAAFPYHRKSGSRNREEDGRYDFLRKGREHRGRRAASLPGSRHRSASSDTTSTSSSTASLSSLASQEDYSTGHPQRLNVSRRVRWVPEDDGSGRAFLNEDGTPRLQPYASPPADVRPSGPAMRAAQDGLLTSPSPAHARTTAGRAQRIFTPPLSPREGIAHLQPSPLLVEIVRSVAFYRNVPCPTRIYPEVILAFDEYLARGITLDKFIPNGPPHTRFFAIRFLDLQHRRADGGRAMPEAVFAWYRTAKSTNIRRFFPLTDLHHVQRGGAGHPYIEKRKVKATSVRGSGNGGGAYGNNNTEDNFALLRNGKKGICNKYINDSYVLQLAFRSLLTNCSEVVAVQAPNPTILLALHVVGDYLSRIGRDL